MGRIIRDNTRFNFTKETALAIGTIFLYWAGYYLDNSGVFGESIIWLIIWGIGFGIILNVCFPAWWIVKKKGEGFVGMGITKNKLGIALVLGILLGAWRFFELIPFLNDKGLIRVMLFNLLSIWEVCFIFCWLFTRYAKAFGKVWAPFLTAFSVGIYHIGTYPSSKISYLVVCVFICGICFAFTDNIFTLWPIYWVIGCSASVLKGYGSDVFSWEAVCLIGVILMLQLSYLIGLAFYMRKARKMEQKSPFISNN